MKMLVLALLVTLGPVSVSAAEADVDPIRACGEKNVPAAVVETIELRTTDRSGAERSLRVRLLGRRLGDETWQSRVFIMSPAAYRHIGVLVLRKEDRTDMFVFTPELDRVRRISRRVASGPALGSPISYEDLYYVQTFLEQAEYRVVGRELLSGRDTYRLEGGIGPKEDGDTPYTRFVAWIDTATCVLMKGEFFGHGREPLRVLDVEPQDLEHRAGHWLPTRFTLSDLRQGLRTEVSILSFEAPSTLPDSEFTETALIQRSSSR